MGKKIEKNNFEQSIKKLEDLVTKMESGDASLEQSLNLFEEGMEIVKSCEIQLREAEKRVESLIDNSNIKTSSMDDQ